jgi:hypothetical protein
MAKLSPFQALVDRQLDNESHTPDENQTPDQPPSQVGEQALSQSGDQSIGRGRGGKSSSPDYQRLTVYLRRETILDLKRRIVGTNVELSDILQDAVELWVREPKP